MAAGSEIELGYREVWKAAAKVHDVIHLSSSAVQWPQEEAQAFSGLRLDEGGFSQSSVLAS